MVRICYGASITETNVENLVRLPDVDGFLVGSTSTKPIFRTIFDLVNDHVKKDFERQCKMWNTRFIETKEARWSFSLREKVNKEREEKLNRNTQQAGNN